MFYQLPDGLIESDPIVEFSVAHVQFLIRGLLVVGINDDKSRGCIEQGTHVLFIYIVFDEVENDVKRES
jgi:hypothetical protein